MVAHHDVQVLVDSHGHVAVAGRDRQLNARALVHSRRRGGRRGRLRALLTALCRSRCALTAFAALRCCCWCWGC